MVIHIVYNYLVLDFANPLAVVDSVWCVLLFYIARHSIRLDVEDNLQERPGKRDVYISDRSAQEYSYCDRRICSDRGCVQREFPLVTLPRVNALIIPMQGLLALILNVQVMVVMCKPLFFN